MADGTFVLKKTTSFSNIMAGKDKTLPESDLLVQDQSNIYQFKFEEANDDKQTVKPGVFVLSEAASEIVLKKAELRVRKLLTSVVNTKAIVDEADDFFNSLDVYKEMEEDPVRKIMIHSPPGFGKTACISEYSLHAIEQDPGTVVIIWPTSEIDSNSVLNFFAKNSEYAPECTRLILIIEDIGGGERESAVSTRAVDSALLDLLDGLRVTWRLPTLIISTTNYMQNLISALADRPGRFDLKLELKPPSLEERIQLAEFIGKRPLSEEDKLALAKKGAEDFSIAHIKEAVVRSRIKKRSMSVVIDELIVAREEFKNDFSKKTTKAGFAGQFDE